uniref:Uncharacterized protein n=1 Tax=Zea mays TaxID=4577 RepID=A0A804LTK4_MAIZE
MSSRGRSRRASNSRRLTCLPATPSFAAHRLVSNARPLRRRQRRRRHHRRRHRRHRLQPPSKKAPRHPNQQQTPWRPQARRQLTMRSKTRAISPSRAPPPRRSASSPHSLARLGSPAWRSSRCGGDGGTRPRTSARPRRAAPAGGEGRSQRGAGAPCRRRVRGARWRRGAEGGAGAADVRARRPRPVLRVAGPAQGHGGGARHRQPRRVLLRHAHDGPLCRGEAVQGDEPGGQGGLRGAHAAAGPAQPPQPPPARRLLLPQGGEAAHPRLRPQPELGEPPPWRRRRARDEEGGAALGGAAEDRQGRGAGAQLPVRRAVHAHGAARPPQVVQHPARRPLRAAADGLRAGACDEPVARRAAHGGLQVPGAEAVRPLVQEERCLVPRPAHPRDAHREAADLRPAQGGGGGAVGRIVVVTAEAGSGGGQRHGPGDRRGVDAGGRVAGHRGGPGPEGRGGGGQGGDGEADKGRHGVLRE